MKIKKITSHGIQIKCIILVIFMHYAITETSGTLDPIFGDQGITLTPLSRLDQVKQSVVNSNNQIIITGITLPMGSPLVFTPGLLLAQYTSNGNLDTTFNSSGSIPGIQTLLVGSRSEGYSIILDSSSNIIVAGMCINNNITQLLLTRFLPTGSIDTTFNSVGYVTQSIGSGTIANTVGLQSTGKIVTAGCSINGSSPNFTLTRFTTAGALDTSFGNNGITITSIGNTSSIAAIAIITGVTNTDYIIAVGNVDNNITVARYTASGILDTTFGTGGIFKPTIAGASSTIAYDVVLDSSNNILIAGSALISGVNQSLLIRLTPSGAFDTTFNTTGYVTQTINDGSEFYSLVIQSNGLIIGGGYAIGRLTNQISLARYSYSGVLDNSYGTNGITLTTNGSIAYAQTLNLQSNGYCVASGIADGTISLERYTS